MGAADADPACACLHEGSRSFHLLTQGVYNRPVVVPGIPTTSATINLRRTDQRYGGDQCLESNSIGYYDAVQASVEQRLTHGLTFRAAYTFGKAINLGGDFHQHGFRRRGPPETAPQHCENCNRFSDQKGLALFDTPQVLAHSYVYRAPFSKDGNFRHNPFPLELFSIFSYRIRRVRLRQPWTAQRGSSQYF